MLSVLVIEFFYLSLIPACHALRISVNTKILMCTLKVMVAEHGGEAENIKKVPMPKPCVPVVEGSHGSFTEQAVCLTIETSRNYTKLT